jgi:hypothetical protein
MFSLRWILALVIVAQAGTPQTAVDARRLTLSAPATIARMTADGIRGEPTRLAWSPDGRRLYLRCVKSDRWGNQSVFHYEITLATGALRSLDREPEWSGRYWLWKSAQASPASPGFLITYETREEQRTAVGVANAGAMAQSGGDPSLGSDLGPQGQAIASRLMQGQTVRTTTLRLKGQPLGEFVNMMPIPGLTFGWAPGAMDAIAFSNTKGRIVIMDRAGHRREVTGSQKALLPAWSDAGSRLAWLQRESKKEIVLLVCDVTGPKT